VASRAHASARAQGYTPTERSDSGGNPHREHCVRSATQRRGSLGRRVLRISGKSGTWRTKDGKFSGTTTYNTDGTAQTTGNFGDFTEDTGVWSIRGDKLCATWKKVRGGKEACFAVKRLSDGRLDLGRNVLTLK
jgi:hypothetical protein